MNKTFPNVWPNEDLLPPHPWGSWACKRGFIPLLAQLENSSKVRHFFGGEEENCPICFCCGKRMRIWAIFDLTDPRLRAALDVPSQWRKFMLPYCPDCPSMLRINIFRMSDAGEVISLVYQNTPPKPIKIKSEVPPFSGIPMALRRMSKDMMPSTEEEYWRIVEEYGPVRAQIGGAPFFTGKPEGLLSPETGKMMQFVASITDYEDVAKAAGCDALTCMGLSGGCLLFFIDWDNGYLGSIYQQ